MNTRENCSFTKKIIRCIDGEGMCIGIRGILLGFSGGGDSTALLHVLKHECERRGIYLHAIHIHHGIRGEEADRDAEFCKKECERLGVDFTLSRVDVPSAAKGSGKSIEQTARELRYGEFTKKIAEDPQLDCIATAHNADDNAETLIYNLTRGCAADGLSGIPHVRYENGIRLIRPMIACSRREVNSYLEKNGLDFIYDSTNSDTVYRRNYIRHELIPRLCELNPSFSDTVLRMNEGIKRDSDFINGEADAFLKQHLAGNRISAEVLANAHEAIS